MKRSNKKGFTIVELVIVIAVIAILAAVLIPTFASLIQKANESNDIQAAKNMNTFLAAANVTGDVNSILDVYDIFEDSGYSVESYKPLYAGRSYYYDKEYNQILYVDSEGKVLYPTEHKDETYASLKHNWMSLSLTLPKTESITYDTATESKTTATVSKPEQYAWVVEQYNEGKINGELEIKLTDDLDFMGAMCVIKEAKGNITIDGGTHTIKNITSNIQIDEKTVHNAEGTNADYYSGGIIAKCTGKDKSITIKNVTFENINVKSPTAGQVGVVIGYLQTSEAEFDNVTLKNSSVIGHRDVGALVGGMQGGAALTLKNNIALDNVKVKTTGGRSGLVIGKVMQSDKCKLVYTELKMTITNSAMSIYEDADLEQKFADGSTIPSDWKPNTTSEVVGADKVIYSFKGLNKVSGNKDYSAYGYKSDALVLVEKMSSDGNANIWEAITTVEALMGYTW